MVKNKLSDSPEDFKLETTSVWNFPERGNWASHNPNYRGNWSPYVPRNVILRYSNENDWVLDQFIGGGTTAVEALLLNRNIIGIDINPSAVELTKNNICNISTECKSRIFVHNACNLSFLKNESIDLICTHPPYSNIIKYSDDIKNDISLLGENEFLSSIKKVAEESYRVLKKEKYLAFLMADIRKKGYIVPLSFNTMNVFLEVGFKLKEIVIKVQHNCSSTPKWTNKNKQYNFLLIAHEYLFIMKK